MAVDFDGVTERIDWGNNPGVPYDPWGNPFTIATWIRVGATLSASSYFWVAYQNNSPTFATTTLLWHDTAQANNTISFQPRQGSTAALSANRVSSTTIAVGAWTHLCARHDGSTTGANAKIYLNGVEVSYSSTSNADATVRDASNRYSLAGRIHDNNRNMNCRIVWPSLWNRQLADDDVAALAAGISPLWFARGLVWFPELHTIADYRDHVANYAGTANGTPTTEEGPGKLIHLRRAGTISPVHASRPRFSGIFSPARMG